LKIARAVRSWSASGALGALGCPFDGHGMFEELRTWLRARRRQLFRLIRHRRIERRSVRFEEKASIYEFERQLFGGGGVPDEDAVSLGLGPKLVTTYSSPLAEKQDKDEYACHGFLGPAERAQLLSEWASRQLINRELSQNVAPVVEQTRRERIESAHSRLDQRRMPTSESEAIQIALQDALVARRMTRADSAHRRATRQQLKSAATDRATKRKPGIVKRVR